MESDKDDQFMVFGFMDIIQGFEKGFRYFLGPFLGGT